MYYIDQVTSIIHNIPDNATVIDLPEGGCKFKVGDVILNAPTTLVPCPDPVPNLDIVRKGVIGKLSKSCEQAILAGFQSSALGQLYSYPTDSNTQTNISYAATHGGNLWCALAGNWEFVLHTQAQAAQVVSDMWAFIQSQQFKLANLTSQVNAATTVAAIQAIEWS